MSGADTLDGLLELAASASRARGDVLLAKLARSFAQALKASASLISHAVDQQRVRTLAVFADGAPQPNYEYALAGTPCAAVLRGEVVHHESGSREDSRRPRGNTRATTACRSSAPMARCWGTCARSVQARCR